MAFYAFSGIDVYQFAQIAQHYKLNLAMIPYKSLSCSLPLLHENKNEVNK